MKMKFSWKRSPIVCGWGGVGVGRLVWAADGMIMKRRGRGVRADPRSAAFYCTTPKGFIMPFVITLTAVNTGESFYVPDQCERFSPVINQGRNLL